MRRSQVPETAARAAFSWRSCGADRRHFPQDFLRKEFSEENILFWQACECFNHVPAHDKKEVRLLAAGGHPVPAKVVSRGWERTVFSE